MLEFAVRALRKQKKLRQKRIGVLLYSDEGRDCRYSARGIERAARTAARVIVLRPGSVSGNVIIGSRGLRKYQLLVEGRPRDLRPGAKEPDVLRWANSRTETMMQLSSRKERLGVFLTDIRAKRFPNLLPHRVEASLIVSYPTAKSADRVEQEIRGILGKKGPKWSLNLVSDRPPMLDRKGNRRFLEEVLNVARQRDIPLSHETSATPSVAGLVPEGTAVLCGLGPSADSPNTPQEAVQRIGLFQRTLLLTAILDGGA
jgi:D-alanine-D-alanine ligase